MILMAVTRNKKKAGCKNFQITLKCLTEEEGAGEGGGGIYQRVGIAELFNRWRILYEQIVSYMNNLLSNYITGVPNLHGSQNCLVLMLMLLKSLQ